MITCRVILDSCAVLSEPFDENSFTISGPFTHYDVPESLSNDIAVANLAPRSEASGPVCIWLASLDSPIVGMLAIVRLLCCEPDLPTPMLQLSPLSLAVEDRSLRLAVLFMDRGETAPSRTSDAGADKKSFLVGPWPENCGGWGCAAESLVLPTAFKRRARAQKLYFIHLHPDSTHLKQYLIPG